MSDGYLHGGQFGYNGAKLIYPTSLESEESDALSDEGQN